MFIIQIKMYVNNISCRISYILSMYLACTCYLGVEQNIGGTINTQNYI